MNFTPIILTYISEWSKKTSICVDVRMEFTNNSHMRLIFSFTDVVKAKVWNKSYEPEFLRECNLSLYDLVKNTLKEADDIFNTI